MHKPAHLIFYLSTLQKPAAGAGFCNVLKYKADTGTEAGPWLLHKHYHHLANIFSTVVLPKHH